MPSRVDNNSIVTHDLQIDVESFIRQDLLNLNQNEAKLQGELRDIHLGHRTDLQEIYSKHGIKTNYQHSQEITGETAPRICLTPTEQSLEESLQNLDNLLIRREILAKESDHAIQEETFEEEANSISFINPFSKSEDLCQQVLQLAQNVSHLEEEEELQGLSKQEKLE